MIAALYAIGTRLVPALLTAAGVVLITAGLLSYADPTAAGVVAGRTARSSRRSPRPRQLVDPVDRRRRPPSPSGSRRRARHRRATPPASIVPEPDEEARPCRRDARRRPGAQDRPAGREGQRRLPAVQRRDVPPHRQRGGQGRLRAAGRGQGDVPVRPCPGRDVRPDLRAAIQKKQAKKMLGMVVQVYTSDLKLHLYEIREYRLHVTDLDGPLAATSEELWLQTSEGPKGTPRQDAAAGLPDLGLGRRPRGRPAQGQAGEVRLSEARALRAGPRSSRSAAGTGP